MTVRIPRPVWASLLLGTTIAGASWAATGDIRVAGDPRPSVLDLVETSPPPVVVAVGADGRNAAASYPDPEKSRRSIVKVFSTYRDEPLLLELNAVVRSMLFSPDGLQVFVATYRPAKKRLGEAQLSSLDVAQGKSRAVMRIPPTSSCLDYWPARASLLIAAENEIRTVRLAGMRSGPLFRIPGPNLAVAALGGSTAVLLGQDRELLLVDLDDPPGEDSMPVRDRAPVPAPVAALAAAPDGSSALARLSDGSVLRITFDPMKIERVGSAVALAALPKQVSSTEIAMAPLPVPPPEPLAIEPPAADETASDPETAAAATPEPSQATQAPPRPETSSDPEPDVPPAPPSWTPEQAPQLWGRVTGEAVAEVREVVLLGPDSIVREARRVRPGDDGLWRADGLEPGRYQIQLAAGGQKVLVTEPRMTTVEVTEGGSIEAPTFNVLRAFVP